MSDHLQYVLLGLGTGAAFAFLGLGVLLVFRSSGVINFAHGAMAMFVAFTFVELQKSGRLMLPVVLVPHEIPLGTGPLSPWPAAAVALVYSGALGAGVYLLIFRPLQQAPALAKLVASVGLTLYLQATVVRNLGADAFGTNVGGGGSLLPTNVVEVLGARIPVDRFWLLGITVVTATVLWAVFRYTHFGLATRAAAESEEGAAVLGYRATTLGIWNWVIATMLAGLAGIFLAPIAGLNPVLFSLFIVPALGAALVGKLSSFSITLFAGLTLGALQSEIALLQFTHSWLPQAGLKEGVPFLVIIGALVLLGKSLPLRGTLGEPPPPRSSRPSHLPLYMAIGASVTVVALFVLPSDYRLGVIQSELTLLLVLSMVVLTGYCGQVSLTQMAFAGAGGFFVSIAADGWGLPFPVPLFLGGATATLFGLAVGLPALRSRGLHFAVLTLAAAVAFDNFFFGNESISGGIRGRRVPSPEFLGIDIGALGMSAAAYPRPIFGIVVLGVIVVTITAMANLRRSATGRHMLAIRARETAAAACGIGISGTKLFAFAVSSFIAGMAGGLMGYLNGAVSREQFTIQTSLLIVALAYIGGVARISGAVLAGIILAPSGILLVFLDDLFPSVTAYNMVIAGAALMFSTITHRDGLATDLASPLNSLGAAIRRSWLRGTGRPALASDGLPVDDRHGEPISVAFFATISCFLSTPWWFARCYRQLREANGGGLTRPTVLILSVLAPLGVAVAAYLATVVSGGWGIVVGYLTAVGFLVPNLVVLPIQINRLAARSGNGPTLNVVPFVLLVPVVGPGIRIASCQAALNACWPRPRPVEPRIEPAPTPSAASTEPAPVPSAARTKSAPVRILPAPTGQPLLSVRDLTVCFGAVTAVGRVSLEVHPGRVVGLIGPNGAGKTTTIDTITGFVTPRTGEILLDGQPLSHTKPSKRNRLGIARTFQNLELFDDLTVEENLLIAAESRTFGSRLRDLVLPGREGAGAEAARAVMDDLGLTSIADRLPTSLSTAERKRVAVGRALASRPRLLLLDEPAAGLDASEGEALGALLRGLVTDGTAILVVDHDVGLMFNICDYIYVLDFGCLIAHGTPDQVRTDSGVINAYLGGEAGDAPNTGATRSRPLALSSMDGA